MQSLLQLPPIMHISFLSFHSVHFIIWPFVKGRAGQFYSQMYGEHRLMHFPRNAFLPEDLLLPLLSSQFHVDHELFSSCLSLFLDCTRFPKVGRHSTRSSDLPLAGISHVLLSIPITSLLPSLNHRPCNSSFILAFPSNFLF